MAELREKLELLRCNLINCHCDMTISKKTMLKRQSEMILEAADEIKSLFKSKLPNKRKVLNYSDSRQWFNEGYNLALTEIKKRWEEI